MLCIIPEFLLTLNDWWLLFFWCVCWSSVLLCPLLELSLDLVVSCFCPGYSYGYQREKREREREREKTKDKVSKEEK